MTWNLFDTDRDGEKTLLEVFSLMRIAIYLFCAVWTVMHAESFTDLKFVAVIAASFGSSVFEMFLKEKINSDGGKKEVDKFSGMADAGGFNALDERV